MYIGKDVMYIGKERDTRVCVFVCVCIVIYNTLF